MLDLHHRTVSVSTNPGFLLLCSLVAVAVAFPTVFVLLDHHGVERLPAHAHAGRVGEIGQTHAHPFEASHAHAGGAPLGAEGADLAVRVSSEPSLLIFTLLLAMALPLNPAFRLGGWSGWGGPLQDRAGPLAVGQPPTPPPTRLFPGP